MWNLFLDQGLNACPLHWQRDSSPLDHQGSPYKWLWMMMFLLTGCEYYDEQEKGYFVFMDSLEKPTSEQRLCSVVEYEVKRGKKEH